MQYQRPFKINGKTFRNVLYKSRRQLVDLVNADEAGQIATYTVPYYGELTNDQRTVARLRPMLPAEAFNIGVNTREKVVYYLINIGR